ncbi:MAG: MarR family transcriptional regulator [Oscillospiraceae bacterium]|nr:MarR family transcriptional regulator [Ruminococcus sp.]MBQ4346195.1 MarR family transcriptional regulator [Oscillospiraceae bacterium]
MNQEYEALKLKNQLCFPLYAASREVIKQYRPYLDALNLTYTQYIAMMVFWEEQKINVKALGKKLFLDSGTLTPVLKSLEAKGLIRRFRCAEDERVLIADRNHHMTME